LFIEIGHVVEFRSEPPPPDRAAQVDLRRQFQGAERPAEAHLLLVGDGLIAQHDHCMFGDRGVDGVDEHARGLAMQVRAENLCGKRIGDWPNRQ